MKWLRLLGVILSLSLEVRVKATEQEPETCLKKTTGVCAIFTRKPSKIRTKNFEMKLRAGSILFRDRDNKWNFIDGTFRVQNTSTIQLRTRVGDLVLNPGAHWVQWRDEKLWVYALRGIAKVNVLSPESETHSIPEGFVNWFGLIGPDNKNLRGIPQMITADLMEQNKVDGLMPDDFNKIKKNEERTLLMASDFYREITQLMEDGYHSRQLASEKKEAQKIKRQKEVIDLFRAKYLSPVDFDEIE